MALAGALLGAAALPASAQPAIASTAAAVAAPDVLDLDISGALAKLESGETTSVALVSEYLARMAAYDTAYGDQPGLNALITVNQEALAEAAELDSERAAGVIRGALHGVPIVVKDNYATADMPTSGGSASLATFQPDADSTAVERLRAAGAIIIAKSNMSEFSFSGKNSISSVRGAANNPYDQALTTGGSSGGVAASVAAAFSTAGVGTDTCGSLLGPSVHQSLVGFRPTMGLTSVSGVLPLSPRQDVSGPVGKSVTDTAILLQVLAGYDPADPLTVMADKQNGADYVAGLSDRALEGKRIAVANWDWSLFGPVAGSDEVIALYEQSVVDLEAQGAIIVDVPFSLAFAGSLPSGGMLDVRAGIDDFFASTPATWPAGLAELTAPADALTWSDIAADAKFSSTISPAVAAYITAQADIPNPAYDAAGAAWQSGRAAIDAYFADNDIDAIALPTSPNPATPDEASNPFCGLGAFTGIPTMTIPTGFTSAGLPAGLELAAPRSEDAELLAMGYDYEQATRHRAAPSTTPELAHPTPQPQPTETPAPAPGDTGSTTPSTASTSGDRLAATGVTGTGVWLSAGIAVLFAGAGSLALRRSRRQES
ncbi:amidase [Agreia sp. PsM10]|uniref:amidase n=1 Tax=Agreia sp. PsM10 TaxID=3030533 RepID=UPI00263A9D57|nr:amidase family protein [Agreia sp. PsM10]